MATTNVELKNINRVTYSHDGVDTNISEVWYCCTNNATCCRIWPKNRAHVCYIMSVSGTPYNKTCRKDWPADQDQYSYQYTCTTGTPSFNFNFTACRVDGVATGDATVDLDIQDQSPLSVRLTYCQLEDTVCRISKMVVKQAVLTYFPVYYTYTFTPYQSYVSMIACSIATCVECKETFETDLTLVEGVTSCTSFQYGRVGNFQFPMTYRTKPAGCGAKDLCVCFWNTCINKAYTSSQRCSYILVDIYGEDGRFWATCCLHFGAVCASFYVDAPDED